MEPLLCFLGEDPRTPWVKARMSGYQPGNLDTATHIILPVPAFDRQSNIRGGPPLGEFTRCFRPGLTIFGGNLGPCLAPAAEAGTAAIDLLADESLTAANAAGKEVTEMREEDSILPSYVFHDALSTSVAITKNGGYLCYLITEKPDNLTAKLSYEEAVNKAQQYLSAHGYDSMKDTYYETDNGVMTLNFAYYDSASQTICYTDLIKVEVSLQDGSILGLDARGYLVNHHDRTIAEPALPVEQAQESLSDALTVDSVRPALIPSSGQNEVATYEFLCSSATGDRILTYINSQTGAEEQLLILLQTPNGTLTK